MSEKRLQEIKDSVNFQREILLAHNMETLCVDEEQELIEEIERLNNIIKEVREYIKNTMEVDEEYPDYMTFEICEYQELLDILDKGNK